MGECHDICCFVLFCFATYSIGSQPRSEYGIFKDASKLWEVMEAEDKSLPLIDSEGRGLGVLH
jgi:hypothetical protein